MSVIIKPINIGEAIDYRRQELGINKSELARRINVPQQHINRILSNSSIDTEKLAKISEALEYNFFDLYASSDRKEAATSTPPFQPASPFQSSPTSEKSSPSEKTETETETQPTSSEFKTTSPTMKDLTIQVLQEKNRILEELIESKNRIISLLEEKFG